MPEPPFDLASHASIAMRSSIVDTHRAVRRFWSGTRRIIRFQPVPEFHKTLVFQLKRFSDVDWYPLDNRVGGSFHAFTLANASDDCISLCGDDFASAHEAVYVVCHQVILDLEEVFSDWDDVGFICQAPFPHDAILKQLNALREWDPHRFQDLIASDWCARLKTEAARALEKFPLREEAGNEGGNNRKGARTGHEKTDPRPNDEDLRSVVHGRCVEALMEGIPK